MTPQTLAHDEDRFARLQAEVEYPEAWKPEPGETLVGLAVRWEEVTLDRDGDERTCHVLTVRTQDGSERSVWCWHFVLRHELVGKVEPGDFVAISYRGRKTKQEGDGDYAAYRVAIDKNDGPSTTADDIPF
jgi:hypothetical protein